VATIDPELVKSFTVAINRPATTQPTTQPAEMREFTIERHKVAPPVLGPSLPAGVSVAPTTQPSAATTQPSTPTTQPGLATTQISAPPTQPSVATTQPSEATTQSAVATTAPTTQPAIASTQPVDDIATAKWIFASGGTGHADDGQVTDLLASLHPLRVEKYIEPAKETGNAYTLTVHAIPAKAADAAEDYVFTFIETPTRVVGTYKDLQFEVV
jgi:hypothetical protein